MQHGDHRVSNRQSHPQRDLSRQKSVQCPGQQHGSRTQYRQHINHRRAKCQQQCVIHPKQQKCRCQRSKGNQQHDQLRPKPTPQRIPEISAHQAGPAKELFRQQPRSAVQQFRIRRRNEKRPDHRRHGKQQRRRCRSRRGRNNTQQICGKFSGQGCQTVGNALQRPVCPVPQTFRRFVQIVCQHRLPIPQRLRNTAQDLRQSQKQSGQFCRQSVQQQPKHCAKHRKGGQQAEPRREPPTQTFAAQAHYQRLQQSRNPPGNEKREQPWQQPAQKNIQACRTKCRRQQNAADAICFYGHSNQLHNKKTSG